jgi:ubiquinone/menaquinone biosynthesis C-methylase UbiE
MPVAERIRDEYGLLPGQKVLDVGCAKGFLLHDLCEVVPGLRVSGVDVSDYALTHAMPGVRRFLVQGSADVLPFADRTFDVVISINTLHNLPHARCIGAIREMERVGRKHRYLQVDSWLSDEQRENFERWQLTAVTYFDPQGWQELLAAAGYTGDYYWTLTE